MCIYVQYALCMCVVMDPERVRRTESTTKQLTQKAVTVAIEPTAHGWNE